MAVVGTATVEIHAALDAVREELSRGLNEALAGLNTDLKINIDTGAAEAKLDALKAKADSIKSPTINVDADTGVADAKLLATKAIADTATKDKKVKVDADTKDAEKAFVDMGTVLGDLGLNADAFTQLMLLKLPAIAGAGAAAGSAIGAAFAALPALLAGVGAGALAAVNGFNGFSTVLKGMNPDATAAQIKAMNDQLGDMGPNAREVATQLGQFVNGPLADLKKSAQDAFMEPMIGEFNKLGGIMPMVTDEFKSISQSVGFGLANSIDEVVNRGPQLQQMFEGMNTLVNTLATQSLPTFIGTFIQMGAAAGPAMNSVADGINSIFTGFQKMISQQIALGNFQLAVQNLGPILSGLGNILNPLIGMLISLGASLGGPLSTALNNIGALITPLTPILTQLGKTVLDVLNAALQELLPILTDLTPQFEEFIQSLSNMLVPVIHAIGPALDQLIKGLLILFQALEPLYGPTSLTVQAMQGLGQIFTNIAPLIAEVGKALGELVDALAGALQPVIPIIVQAVTTFADALVPVIGNIGEIAKTIIDSLAPVLPQLAQAFNKIIEAIAPLLPQLGELIVKLVQAIAPVLPDIVNAFIGVANAIAAILPVLFPLIPPLVSLALSILPPLAAVLKFVADHSWLVIAALSAFAGLKVAETVAGWATKLTDFTTKLSYIGQGTEEAAGGFSKLKSGFEALKDFPSTIGPATTAVKGFAVSLATNLWAGLVSATTAVWGFTASLLANPITWIVLAIAALIAIIILVVTHWKEVTKVVGEVWDKITGFATWLGSVFVKVWQDISSFFEQRWNAFTGAISTGLKFVQNLWNTVWGAISGFFSNVWGQISRDFMTAWTFIENMLKLGLILVEAIWNAAWTGIKVFFGAIWDGIKAVVTTVWNAIVAFLTPAITAFAAIFSAIWNTIRTVFEAVWNAIKTVVLTVWSWIRDYLTLEFNVFKTVFLFIWNLISTVFTTVWNAIKTTAVTIWTWISSFFTTAFNAFTAVFEAVWNAISSFFSAIWNAISAAAQAIWNAISGFFIGAFNAFTGFFQGVWNGISSFFTGIWNGIKDTAVSIWNDISGFFTGAFNVFKTFFTGVWNDIKQAFSDAFGGIKQIATDIWQGIKDIFSGAINLVIKVPNWIIDHINDLFHTSIPDIAEFHFAEGGTPAGKVHGLGGRTQDRVLSALSPDEHVLSASEVDGLGGHSVVEQLRMFARTVGLGGMLADGGMVKQPKAVELEEGHFVIDNKIGPRLAPFLSAINAGQAEAVRAAGGPFSNPFNLTVPTFQQGGALLNGIAVAQSMNGKPYIWGGASPDGADCSGYMAIITNALRENPNPYFRLGTTDTMPWSGFTSGLTSSFALGDKFDPDGHTAGTLAGVNVESGGSHGNVAYGGPAVGAEDGYFNLHFSLPDAGGTYAPGTGGGGSAPDYGAIFDKLAGWLHQGALDLVPEVIPSPPTPHMFDEMATDKINEAWSAIRDTAIKIMSSIVGSLTGSGGGALGTVAKALTGGLLDNGGFLMPGTNLLHNNTGNPELVMPLDMLRSAIREGMRDDGTGAPNRRDDDDDRWIERFSQGLRRWRDNDHDADDRLPRPVPPPPPPPIIPKQPTTSIPVTISTPQGDIGAAFRSALSQFAPELSLAISAGSATQIVQFGQELLASPQRMAALNQSIADALGQPVQNMAGMVQDVVSSALPTAHAEGGIPDPTMGAAGTLKTAQSTLSSSTTSSSSADVTIHPGAFQVVVNGNADSVTVSQLQRCLQDWNDELLHQVRGRR